MAGRGLPRGAVLAGVIVSLTLAACGNSGATPGNAGSTAGGTGSASSTPTPGQTASVAAYDGPEAKYFAEVPEPTPKSGFRPRIGILGVNGAVASQRTTVDSAAAQVRTLGGEPIILDAQINPQTQISQFQQLISQKVDAIIVQPASAAALNPSLQQAKQAGIPVIATAFPPDVTQPANPALATNITVGNDYAAYSTMRAIAERQPGSTYAVLGSSIPVPQLQYLNALIREWGPKVGLKMVGEEDAKTDDPTGFVAPLQTIFTKYPDADSLVTYNDESAVSAGTQLAQHPGSHMQISTINGGEDIGRAAIAAGRLHAAYFMRWNDLGKALANATYATLTKQGNTLPKTIVLKSDVVTKDNVSQSQPWAK